MKLPKINLHLLVLTFSLCFGFHVQAQQKNFIIIFTDDQGYEDLSCFGSKKVNTPNIDKMANEGLKLTSFYVASSVCSPSRAALLTGRMPKRVKVPAVLRPLTNEPGLSPKEITIAELLKKKKYKTSIIGKWHLGHEKQFLPLNQGFDSYYGIPYSNNMSIAKNIAISKNIKLTENYTLKELHSDINKVESEFKKGKNNVLKNKAPLLRNNEIVEYPTNQNTITERYTDKAISFIKKNKKKPFFLYLAHAFPHVPIHVGEKFKGVSGSTPYYDAIAEIDWSVGEIFKTLKKEGLDKNTVVIFTSDNGPNSHGSAKPLKGRKFLTYEGGQRVPAIIWAPGEIKPGTVSNELVSSLDMFPTIAHYAGIKMPTDRKYDGYNVANFFNGKTLKSPRKEMYYYASNTNHIDGVRYKDWKFLYNGKKIPKKYRYSQPPTKKGQLYNLKRDISERNNLVDTYPEKVKELIKMMEDFDQSIQN